MSVSCEFNGRLGNICFSMAQVIAYCKRHNLQYHFPTNAWACTNGLVPIRIANTAEHPPSQPVTYTEPMDSEGHPYYHEIPVMDNVLFRGYYQSFKYFEDYRQDILDVFDQAFYYSLIPDTVSIHVRRGDCVTQIDGFPMAPLEYYYTAIRYMQDKGYNKFMVYSDDIPWCMMEFTSGNFDNAEFSFSNESSEVVDFSTMASCEHNIIARSTFSLMAGWYNKNPNKIVLCPSIEQHYWWRGQNLDLLKGTEHWLKQLTW